LFIIFLAEQLAGCPIEEMDAHARRAANDIVGISCTRCVVTNMLLDEKLGRWAAKQDQGHIDILRSAGWPVMI
jgi:hypothetical protein